MHEFGVARSIVDGASAEARRAGARCVTRIRCRIGVLRQIDESLLTEAFAIARQGTLCDRAELSVEKTFTYAECRICDTKYPVRDWVWTCPSCGAEAAGMTGGDELELVSIDAEVDDGD